MERTNKNFTAPSAKGLDGAMRRAALVLLLAVLSVVTASAQLTPDGYSHTVVYRMSTVGGGSESIYEHWNTGETALFFREENGWQNNAQTQWGPVEYRYSTSFNKTNNDQSASFVFTPYETNYDPAINIAISWNSSTTTFNLLQYHDWEQTHVSGSGQGPTDYNITKVAGMFRGASKDAEWTVTIQSLDATKKITSVEFINKEGETKFSESGLFTTTYTSPSLSNATMGETDNNDHRNGVHQIKVTFSDIPSAPWSGVGTEANPFIIHTVSDLQELATGVNSGIAYAGYYFAQDADIDCSGHGMTPIGNYGNTYTFKGNYNGQNNKIINYHLGQAYFLSALFGYADAATLTNIVMQNCNIDASSVNLSYAAGICSYCTNGTTISNCHVTGTIKGDLAAGGIVAAIEDANVSVSDCFADVTVTVVNTDGKRGKIYGATKVHPTTSGCYYYDNGDGVGGCGYNESGTAYNNTEIAPVYALTASNGLTLAETNVAVTHDGTPYFVNGATATLNVSDNNNSIVGMPTVSGTGATYTLAADRKSMTVTVGSADVTVTANLDTTQGSCGAKATWSLADNDNDGTYETLTISGTGAVQNYSQANPAPWGNAITIANVGDGITGIGDYAFANCSSLQRVNINNSGAVSIGSNTFSGCNALQYIVFPSIAAEQQNTTGNWEAYATKRRAQCGSQHFAVTTETGTAVYAIATEQDLRYLVYVGGASSGQTFRQTADITLNGSFSPIGDFSGTYDGGDKTISGLTISGNHQSAGLFGYVGSGVTVKNVRLISPSVTSRHSGGAWVAALIGNAQQCTVQNCLVVNPTVSATASSNDNRVGILFGSLSNATVQNCFVINPNVSGTGTSYVGAICGYAYNGGSNYHCTLTNVYYYNSSLGAIGFNNNSDFASLTRVGRARKVTLGSGMANVSPVATEPANGFVYDNVSYYREGLQLILTDNLGIALDGYTKHYYANGTDLEGTTYTVNSTDGDATLIAAFRSDGQQHEVTYVDAQGESHTTQAIPLDGSMTSLSGGTYYVGADITFTGTITLTGNVTLILADGKTMNVGTSDNRIVGGGILDNNGYKQHTFTIYGQSLDETTAGHLSIYNQNDDGIYTKNYNQQSGNVTVNSTTYNYTINCDYFNLSGSKLIAINNSGGTGIFGNQNISILGGQLDTRAGNEQYALTTFHSITLGWTNATDRIYASSYGGTVNIASGQAMNNGTQVLSGTISDMSLINGKTLTPKLAGSGTTDDPYLITNVGGWDLFCDLVENSTYTFQGNVKLGADISVSRMAGSESKPFAGHFDGQNYTLTFNCNTSDDYVAPFRYVTGGISAVTNHATISNLNVVSTINGSTHLAGLIANQKGLVDLTNCHVTATIASTATTASYCAGLVSHAAMREATDQAYGNENDGTLTISGCTVSGSISTYGSYAGGFVGMAEGKTSIVNSKSSVTINSFVSGNGTHGGFIGLQQHTLNYANVKATITGCLFNGKLTTTNGTTNCGGFIGSHNGGELKIKDCLYAPADLANGETEISDGYTFVGNGTVGSNCIYTRTLGTAQGKATHSITAGEYVTISNVALINFSSNPAVYNVSGITSYDWGGISCRGNLYICEGAHVSLVLSNDYPEPAPAGSVYGYTATVGTLEDNGNGTYTLKMPDADVTINVDTENTITLEWSGTGTEDDPYMIYSKDQLDLVASRMYQYGYNYGYDEGHPDGYFFKLGADIVYPYTTSTENNFTPIGMGYPYPNFQGTFDGDGHTISGIRINGDYSQGLFGEIFGTVKNVILADAIITGSSYVGGIVGSNYGTLENNLVIGSTISATGDNSHGAICGENNGTLDHNYYTACTVAGVENATGVGCGSIYDDETGDNITDDITEMTIDETTYYDGAVPALRDNADNTTAIGLLAALPANLDLGWGAGKYSVQLTGRTLYKDGAWNTLCLPFAVELDGSALEGAVAKTLVDATMSGTHVTLNFSETPVTTLEAGKPYIIKWAGDGTDNIVEPVFTGVTVVSSTAEERTITKADGHVKFIGYYNPFTIDTPANDDIYYMTADNTLKHTGKQRTLKACRAYFQFSEAAAARQMVLDFGEGETTSLSEELRVKSEDFATAAEWYTLDGRKLSGKPTTKGMYIHGGHKVVIK
ncbi:MAG: leucine-rich repeat protein [Bacteroidaceae bacterium]|nr:leucine-rich repeat protein [Bacteroidaceae bacterium]